MDTVFGVSYNGGVIVEIQKELSDEIRTHEINVYFVLTDHQTDVANCKPNCRAVLPCHAVQKELGTYNAHFFFHFPIVVLATDQVNARSILMYQQNLDKIAEISSHSAMGVAGPNCDLVNFSEYISKNLKLYELSNDGLKLSTHAQANFCRGELAKALRKGPFQLNVILGGYDEKVPTGGSLYVMDYLGSCAKVNYGAQGYASNFCLSIMDRDWEEGLTEEQAVKIVEHCIRELQMRFLINQSNFIIKVIDKDGLRTLKFGADPADN